MKLTVDWKRVLCRAWSVHCMGAAATIILIVEPVVGLLADFSTGWGFWLSVTLKVLSGFLTVLGIWARVIKQKDFQDADQ